MSLTSVYDPDVRRLIKALGLEGLPATKVVLVIDCNSDDPVTLYVQAFAEREKVRALADAFEGLKVIPAEAVLVDERGDVAARG